MKFETIFRKNNTGGNQQCFLGITLQCLIYNLLKSTFLILVEMGNSHQGQILHDKLIKNIHSIGEITERVEKELQKINQRISSKTKNIGKGINRNEQQMIEIEERFSIIKFPLSEELKQERNRRLKMGIWFGQMTHSVFSGAFKKFTDDKLTFEQTICLANESYLYNLFKLINYTNLSQRQLQFLDKKLKQTLLPYFQTKYPQNYEKQVNYSLRKRLRKTDDYENNAYDLIEQSQVKFQYSLRQEYDQKIMKFLNYVIERPQFSEKCKKQGKINNSNQNTLYSQFHTYFQNLFTKLYNRQQVDQMINDKNSKKEIDIQFQKNETHRFLVESLNKKQREKYREKVENYTKYLIGRKINKNTLLFKPEQMSDGHLIVRDISLMRIVSKWCQELRKNFKSSYQIAHKHGQFRMKDGSERYLSSCQAQILQKLLSEKQQNIKNWVNKVRDNNYEHQLNLSRKKYIENEDLSMLPEQQVHFGLFSSAVSKNYQFYLVCYLKKLIHQLLTVMKQLQIIYAYSDKNQKPLSQILDDDLWEIIRKGKLQKVRPYQMNCRVVNLITFRIGDLLRCKCSSGQRQISALYNQIEKVSQQNPKQLKVIRVKDRLDRGTKDVLINILFKEKILIEVQLAVHNNKSKFISNTQKFKHYLYELQRGDFGPISQMCNIWVKMDPRASYFMSYFEEKKKPQYYQIQEENSKNSSFTVNLPFQCRRCQRYGTNLFKKTDKLCLHCDLEQKSYNTIRKYFPKLPLFKQEPLQIRYSEILKQESQFPKFGLVLKMNLISKGKINVFQLVQKNKKTFIMIKKNDQYQSLGEVTNSQQKQCFFNQNLIFTLSTTYDHFDDMTKEFFVPEILKQVYEKKKNQIQIIGEGLNHKDLEKWKESFDNVEKVNFSQNEFKRLSSIVQKFPKTKILVLNSNDIRLLEEWQKFKSLEELSLQNNSIKDFQIRTQLQPQNSLFKLRKLNLRNNALQKIPQDIGIFKNIILLNFSFNLIQEIPLSLCKLYNLQVLNLQKNKIHDLPPSFNELKKLQTLNISRNKISTFPNPILQLKQLLKLNISYNHLSSLPNTELQNLQNLKEINLSKNNISTLPETIKYLKKLKQFDLQGNPLRTLPKQFSHLMILENIQLDSERLDKDGKKIFDLWRKKKQNSDESAKIILSYSRFL